MKEINDFIKSLNKSNKKVWIRQVIVPGIMDNEKYIDSLIKYLKQIKNIEKIDFLPYHKLGREKYIKLGIPYPYESKKEMDKEDCKKLYQLFLNKYQKDV